MARQPIPIKIKPKDLTQIGELLRGGIQQVRVVLRALALQQLAGGLPRLKSLDRFLLPQSGPSDRPSLQQRRPGGCAVRQAAARGAAADSGRRPEAAYRRHGLQPAARREVPVGPSGWSPKRPLNANWSQSGTRDNPDSVAKPRVEAVAGKKCGAWRSWTRPTSKRWRTCWPPMRSPTILPSPSLPGREAGHAACRGAAADPAKPGKPAKQDNEYERCGTANLFGAVEPLTGRHFTTATPTFRRGVRSLGGEHRGAISRGPDHPPGHG